VRGAGTGAGRRWAVVAAVVGVLVALPPVIGALPASDADVPAAELRQAAMRSVAQDFSGYAESAGGLTLPVGSPRFTSVVDLFSDRTQMRVWWRAETDARVDVVTAGGETSYRTDPQGGWIWAYEADRAARYTRAPLHLPAAPDLLPSSLGRRLLSEATDEELSRIGADRVAGRDALGLRITPAAEASSVHHVDVWIDPDSGLPLQVQLYAKGSGLAALDTRFLDLELTEPDASLTRFSPPPGSTVTTSEEDGVLARARRELDRVALPGELAGLPRRHVAGAPEAVGLYGRGVTLLVVVPVSGRVAGDVAESLRGAPDAVDQPDGVRAAQGPLGLMVLDPPGRGAYLVTGTVTLDALAAAAGELGFPEEGG
jgi:outer membrane lipoprotein-sorting protein